VAPRERRAAARGTAALAVSCAVVIFRCTQTLLDRLPDSNAWTSSKSTTALGDWYVKLLFTRPQHLLLGVSERSRLAVVFPAKELGTMAARFQDALEDLLGALQVSPAAIAAERAAMKQAAFAKTVDRHVLGSLNEFAFAVQWARRDRPRESLEALNLWLAETPILPLKDFPNRMTCRLLEWRLIH
jgi:hypothetical protein